jgi:tetratricopeptide (TPR) repeat protein
LSLSPDLAEAHGAQALLAMNRAEYLAAIGHANRALELNPSYIDAMNWRYLSTSYLGRYREQRKLMEQLLRADPLSIVGQLNYAGLLAIEGRTKEAHEVSDRLLSQYPWAGYTSHGTVALDYEGDLALGLSWLLYAFSADATDTQSNWFLNRAFIMISEYQEARRVSDDLAYMVDAAQGDFEQAVNKARERVEIDPSNPVTVQALADVLHQSGNIAEAQAYYEQLMNNLHGRPIIDVFTSSLEPSVRLALGRKQSGDAEGANSVVRLIRQDLQAQREAGFTGQYLLRSEAMLEALEGNREAALATLRQLLDVQLVDPNFLLEPTFEDLRGDPQFQAMQAELDQRLQQERQRVLQLICFENPVPDSWQPLRETCQNVTQKP